MLCKIYILLSNSNIPILLWSKKSTRFLSWAPSTMFWTADMCSKLSKENVFLALLQTQQGECVFSAAIPSAHILTFDAAAYVFSSLLYIYIGVIYSLSRIYLICSFLSRAHIKMAAVIRSAPGSFPSVFLSILSSPRLVQIGAIRNQASNMVPWRSWNILKLREQCREYAFSRSVDLFTRLTQNNHIIATCQPCAIKTPLRQLGNAFRQLSHFFPLASTQLDTTETLRKMAMVPIYRKPIGPLLYRSSWHVL